MVVIFFSLSRSVGCYIQRFRTGVPTFFGAVLRNSRSLVIIRKKKRATVPLSKHASACYHRGAVLFFGRNISDWQGRLLNHCIVWFHAIPLFHHSTIPPFHYSTIPLFHSSTIPLPHYSTFPLFHYSTIPLRIPLFHYSTLPFFHSSTRSLFHCSNVSLFHCSIFPLFHFSTIPLFDYSTIISLFHNLHCYTITSITLSHCSSLHS